MKGGIKSLGLLGFVVGFTSLLVGMEEAVERSLGKRQIEVVYSVDDLIEAVKKNEVQKVKYLVEVSGVEITSFGSKENQYRDPLMEAVAQNSETLVQYFLANGAYVKSYHPSGQHPLRLAVESASYSIVESLAAKIGSCNNQWDNEMLRQSFMLAINKGRNDVIALLFPLGAININMTVDEGPSVLQCAVEKGATEVVRSLLARNGNDREVLQAHSQYIHLIDYDHNAQKALAIAIEKNNIEITRMLLAHGAHVNYAFEKALHVKNLGSLKLLLDEGCMESVPLYYFYELLKINDDALIALFLQKNGRIFGGRLLEVALVCAVKHYDIKITQRLLDRGVSVALFLDSAISHMLCHVIMNSKNVKLLELLFECGAVGAINSANNPYKATPLMCAVKKRKTMMVDLLLKQGADPNIKNENQETPLIYAAKCSNAEVLDILLMHEATDINAQDSVGCTALLHLLGDQFRGISMPKKREIIKKMISKGIDHSLTITRVSKRKVNSMLGRLAHDIATDPEIKQALTESYNWYTNPGLK